MSEQQFQTHSAFWFSAILAPKPSANGDTIIAIAKETYQARPRGEGENISADLSISAICAATNSMTGSVAGDAGSIQDLTTFSTAATVTGEPASIKVKTALFVKTIGTRFESVWSISRTAFSKSISVISRLKTRLCRESRRGGK
jgi:hypothetical protein